MKKMMQREHVDSKQKGAEVILEFNNLSVWTREETSWWRNKITKQRSVLLQNGEIIVGEFVAVIGPSGAGKTTFLSFLAGKCTLPSEGTVLVNSTNVKNLVQGVVEIVPQFEVFVDSLSVKEHLNFMVEMKLGGTLKSLKMTALNSLMCELKLKEHANTTIRDLSGGERRLLSLATSLISNPKIIICDEPTTGLDCYNAALVIDVLKNLSNSGNIVICSVHQPSSELFREFNSIILLAEGKLLFHGNHDMCKELFESVQLRCPENYNPAEFYIRAISGERHSKDSDINKIYIAFKHRFYNKRERYSIQGNISTLDYAIFKTSRRNWFIQLWLLIWRSSLTLKRNKLRHFFELVTGVLISAFVIGICYVGASGTTQQGIQDFRGLLWLLTSEVAFGIGYTSLIAFEFDLTLFKREAGIYSCSAFYVSRLISLIPKSIIWPISYVTIASVIVNFPNPLLTGVTISISLIGTGIAAASYGLCLGALFTSSHLTTEVMPCFDVILVLTSGAFLRISTIPVWLYGLKYLSHFYYGMDAVSNIYWRQIDYIDCTWNATICISNGASVLAESGYSNNFALRDSLGLILITIGWCVIGYFGLWREKKKGYAY